MRCQIVKGSTGIQEYKISRAASWIDPFTDICDSHLLLAKDTLSTMGDDRRHLNYTRLLGMSLHSYLHKW